MPIVKIMAAKLAMMLTVMVLSMAVVMADEALPDAPVEADQQPAQESADAATDAEAETAEASDAVVDPRDIVPVYDSIIIANEHAELVLTSEQGAVRRFNLRGVHPIVLPDHYVDEGQTQRSTEQNLSVMGIHHPTGPLHNWLGGLRLSGYGPNRNRGASWEVIEQSSQAVTFAHVDVSTGLEYQLRYVLRDDRPTADIALLIRNPSDGETVELSPVLYPINGVHQDVGRNEGWHLTYAEHRGGARGDLVRRDSFPSARDRSDVSQVDDDFDYVALKSRYFVAIWQNIGLDLGPDVDWVSPIPERRAPSDDDASGGGGPGGGPGGGGGPGTTAPVATRGDDYPHRIQFFAEGYEEGAGGRNTKRQAFLTMLYADAQGQPFRLQPGENLRMEWSITVSSMRAADLSKLTPMEQRLEYTDAFHRFFRVLSDILTWMLNVLAAIPGVGYGLGVVLLTILIKAALFRTTYKQQKSMLAMQKLAPELKRIQEQYKSDPQTRNAKTMELWRKHGVNPLGGCLPIFIQMPIFIALYQSFSHVAELRGESFLWLADLTLPDQVFHLGNMGNFPVTINVLPILYMVISLFMTFSNKPPAASAGSNDQAQQMMKIMRWLPVMFGVIFYNMPSGLVLYFTMSALISTIEIKWIRHRLGADKK
ncbi:MAG: membrane protein insertase YidC [Planctomycetota bacterium]|nr:MAG: membrane protein insertase YidC [Planctomycetota bacterium]